MKYTTYFCSFVIALLLVFQIPEIHAQETTQWVIKTDESKMGFRASHFGLGVSGEFHSFDGSIVFSPDDLENSKVSISIAAKSVDTDNNRRDNHLRDPDFFEVDTWPYIQYTATKFQLIENDTFLATGTLTIKETTKEIEVPFQLRSQNEHKTEVIIDDFTLNRYDYGVGTDSFMERRTISNNIKLDIRLVLTTER